MSGSIPVAVTCGSCASGWVVRVPPLCHCSGRLWMARRRSGGNWPGAAFPRLICSRQRGNWHHGQRIMTTPWWHGHAGRSPRALSVGERSDASTWNLNRRSGPWGARNSLLHSGRLRARLGRGEESESVVVGRAGLPDHRRRSQDFDRRFSQTKLFAQDLVRVLSEPRDTAVTTLASIDDRVPGCPAPAPVGRLHQSDQCRQACDGRQRAHRRPTPRRGHRVRRRCRPR